MKNHPHFLNPAVCDERVLTSDFSVNGGVSGEGYMKAQEGFNPNRDRKIGFRKNRVKSAFSLVETLIVLSIIAVLFALGLPVLENVRKASRAAVCTSNLRQIDIGLRCYSGDFNGFLPPVEANTNGTVNAIAEGSWVFNSWKYYGLGTYVNQKSGIDENSERIAITSVNKTIKKNIFVCPETLANRTQLRNILVPTAFDGSFGNAGSKAFHAYGMISGPAERIFGFKANEFPINRVWIEKPSETALITESLNPRVSGQLFTDNRGIIPHNSRCNILFYDGHVEKIHYNNIPIAENTMFWQGADPIP